MGAVRPWRRDAGIYVTAAEFVRVQDLRTLIAELNHFKFLFDQGFEFPDPDATGRSYEEGTGRALAEIQWLIDAQIDTADALFPHMLPVGRPARLGEA